MTLDVHDEKVVKSIKDLIETCCATGDTFEAELVTQLIQNSLRLLNEKHDTGQLKLITRAMKEMRYAYRIFNQYKVTKRISIFGSARTPEHHPDYLAAKELSTLMVESGWMCITGAANGIMKAGLEGHREESGFGLSIRLPFEIPKSPLIEGDPKHITFRYFFTRKLMFMSHADAVAAFPGGFGTMDELFEALTLMQTGKAGIVPVIVLEGKDGKYWQYWEHFIEKQFMDNGWTSPEDRYFYHVAKSPEEARDHILHFYKRYHSSRYVKDNFVIRLKEKLTEEQMAILNEKFKPLVQSGDIHSCEPFPEETNELDLYRITFVHNRTRYGMIRMLIDQINAF